MDISALASGTIIKSQKRTYTVRRVLGQGAFGITYLVDTPMKMGAITFKANFALKELFVGLYCFRSENSCEVGYHPTKAQEVDRYKQAFVAEAQRLQKLGLEHTNIVKVDEVFEANNTAYYVMEYLEGGTLEKFVADQGGRLTFAQASVVMRPICDAVAMLHNHNVGHYDIKPQNIVIQQDEDGIRPVLIDFGLAKHYDEQGHATSTIAAAGYTAGYAPLEQYAGFSKFAPTADVYALAATFVYCLTGHAPAPAAELNRESLREELINRGLDFMRTGALLKAMALLPADRTPDAGALLNVLYALMTEEAPIFAVASEQQSTADDEEDYLQAMEEYYDHVEKIEKSGIPTQSYRIKPSNLDLQVTFNGYKYYFSQDEWSSLSSSEQSRFTKIGLVIDYNGQLFVVKLNMEQHGKSGFYSDVVTWFTLDEAKQWLSNIGGGWRLPDKDEGKAMADQYKAVRAAIKAYGCDEYTGGSYLTGTKGFDGPWVFSLNNEWPGVFVVSSHFVKFFTVRAVCAI